MGKHLVAINMHLVAVGKLLVAIFCCLKSIEQGFDFLRR